jgi:hypothetical protein
MGNRMDLSNLRQQVARALGGVEKSIERFVDAISHSSVWVTVDGASRDGDAIRRACEAYSAIDYGMEDEVQSSVVCLGVIGATSDIVKRAEAVNAAKNAFKEVCVPLRRIQVRVPVKNEGEPTRAIPAIRVILRNIQRSDLNLLAAYRKIPILGAPPASVTYTRANTRSVYRKSLDQLFEMLGSIEGPAAIADRARLMTLGRRETHLALVRYRYENIRANILYQRLDPRGRGRIQVAAELPLLYATGRRAVVPEVRFPVGDESPPPPPRVRESELDAHPFLHALPVYRYRS